MRNRSWILLILILLPLAVVMGYSVVKGMYRSPEQGQREARDAKNVEALRQIEALRQVELAIRDQRRQMLGEAVVLAMEFLGTTGTVVAVNGDGLVTVSLGRTHEVQEGARFHIVREKEYVGSFLVEEVRKGWVAGHLDPALTGAGAPPRNEDRAWTE